MDFIDERIGDIAVVAVQVDRATIKEADDFKSKLSEIIDDGFNKLVIDLSQCEFIDSTFLGVLVSTLKRAVRQKGDLKLIGFQPAVRSMFELTRMYRVFDSFSNVDDAVQSFNK